MPALAYRTTMPKPDDPEIQQAAYDCQRTGYSHRVTAAKIGIGITTLTDWLKLGRTELTDPNRGELGSHAMFAAHFEQGAAECEAENTDHIMAARYDRAAAFVPALVMNKARNGDEWVEKRDVTATLEAVVTFIHELGPRAERAILARREELESLQAPSETDTGGNTDVPLPLLPETTETVEQA